MPSATEPDDSLARQELPHFSSDLETLSAVFRRFGEVECHQIKSPLYEQLCYGIADDPEILTLTAVRREGQPPPNILFAAVHCLLLRDVDDRLREYYPDLTPSPLPPGEAYAAFREFCFRYDDDLRELISTKTVQTNVVGRSLCLLPAFAVVAALGGGRPLANIEVGASAGLNLLWEQYHYEYGLLATWGDSSAPVRLAAEVRGDVPLPKLPETLRAVWATGIDLHPVSTSDEAAVLWLRSLVWPENQVLAAQLSAAIDVAKQRPPRLVEGDASMLLPALLDEAPADATLCVFATHALHQFPRDALLKTLKSIQEHSMSRPVYFVSMEGTAAPHSELKLTIYEGGERLVIDLANCHPHGYWLEWLYRKSS